jgi:hypothetical protein
LSQWRDEARPQAQEWGTYHPDEFFPLSGSGGVASLLQTRGTRPFAKNAKERGTHRVGDASMIESLGHPPENIFY